MGSLPQVSGRTRLVGIIGWPVEHSMSPAMQNAAFSAAGLDYLYVPLPVYPDHIAEALRGLRAMGFVGANVTVPHKEIVLDHLDDISPAALTIGAVNTIIVREGELHGDNTDAAGFIASLAEAGFDPPGCYAAVLGAGGAARSVVYGLAKSGARQVQVFNRNARRAARLCQDMVKFFPDVRFEANSLQNAKEIGTDVDLVVNTTSVGMWPDVDASPWPENVDIPAQLTVSDLVYNPVETRLLAQAKASGADVVPGLGMLVYQGATAFELWTGQPAPVDVMKRVLESAFQLSGEE